MEPNCTAAGFLIALTARVEYMRSANGSSVSSGCKAKTVPARTMIASAVLPSGLWIGNFRRRRRPSNHPVHLRWG
jgi:hypothetical protein